MVEQFNLSLQKCNLGKEGLGLANFEQLYETSILMVSEVKVSVKIVKSRIFSVHLFQHTETSCLFTIFIFHFFKYSETPTYSIDHLVGGKLMLKSGIPLN